MRRCNQVSAARWMKVLVGAGALAAAAAGCGEGSSSVDTRRAALLGLPNVDLGVTISDNAAAVSYNSTTTYTIVVTNAGPDTATNATLTNVTTALITAVNWTCVGTSGATCATASGSGAISSVGMTIPANASVTFTVNATIGSGSGLGSLIDTATATVALGTTDLNPLNNVAIDTDAVNVARTLNVTKTGAAYGTVSALPALFVPCAAGCASASGLAVNGTTVAVTATPITGATFSGWGGACASAGTATTCNLTMSSDNTVSATFLAPPTISVVSGSGQTAATGAAFTNPLVVKVVDSNNAPVAGDTVTFTAPLLTAGATFSSTTATTAADGTASVTATASAIAGQYAVTASIPGGSTASFALTNYGAPATVTVVAGSGQSTAVGTAFVNPLTVQVKDLAGDPVPNAPVTFSAPLNGANLSNTTVTTDANGEASVTGTAASSALTYAVTASTGLALPASLQLTNTPGAAAQIQLLSGSGQSAVVGMMFTNPLTVAVVDLFGNIEAGVPLTFTAPSSGPSATLSATSAITNALGDASVTATANSIAGSYTVTASLLGIPLVSFQLTNLPGGAGTILISGGNAQTTTTGTAFANPLAVKVLDTAGNPVSGATVMFAAPTSGASASFSATSIATGSDGTAQVIATANAVTGTYTATASVAGVTTPASFTLTNQALISLTPASKTVAPHGTATFSAAGGSGAGYVFSLGTNASGATIDPSSGLYTAGATPDVTDVVNVRDSAGHVASAQVHVGDALAASIGVSQVSPGGTTKVTTSGGSGTGLTYAITTNRSGGSVDASGNYKAGRTGNVTDVVTVTDSAGNTATVNVPVGPAVSLTGSAAVAPQGTITFSASGGSGTGFTYALTTNASGGSINPTTGVYTAGPKGGVTDTITATDSLGNIASGNVAVGSGVALTPASASVAPGGSVAFMPSGGSGAGYTFALTTNGSGGSINATSGAYLAGPTGGTTDVVTVTDGLGNKATASISVGGGLIITPSSASVSPHGSLAFLALGGSSLGYTYSLPTNGSGGTVDPVLGLYTAGATGGTTDVVRVTDSLGNKADATVTVGGALSISPSNVNVTPLGVVPFMVSGGSGAGYTFSVTQGKGIVDPLTGIYVAPVTGNETDLVTVKDSLGNTSVATVTVGAGLIPSGPSLGGSISVPPRGSAPITVSGGTPPYSYALTLNGSGANVDPVTGAYTAGSTPLRTDVVTVTDANGAQTAVMVNVGPGVTVLPALSVATSGQTITFTSSGGSGAGFTYALTTNASGATINPATGAYTAGGTTGIDTITATDSLGNTGTAAVTVGGVLTIAPLVASVAPGGTQQFTASGGSGGDKFSLLINSSGGTVDATTGLYTAGNAPAAVDTVQVTDSSGTTATAVVTVGLGVAISPKTATVPPGGTISFSAQGGGGLGYTFKLVTSESGGTITADGSYKAGTVGNTTDVVKVTDLLGNSDTATVTVSAPLTLTASAATVAPKGTATFTALGGSGGGYSFVVKMNGSGANIVSTTGAYTAGAKGGTEDVVQVTDALGNTASQSIAVSAGLTITPAAPTVSPGGTVKFQTSGGSGTGVTFALTTNDSGGSIDASTGNYAAGTKSGVFDVVQATDSLGNTATVNVVVGAALSVSAMSLSTAPRGQATIMPMGGTGGYQFTVITNASGGMLAGTSGAYTAGPTGNVTDVVKVSDSSGASVSVTIKVGPGVTIAPATGNVSPGGKLSFSTSGGSGTGYVFSLAAGGSGATVDHTTGAYVAGAVSGTDTVTVTDSLGNSASATVLVGAPIALALPNGVDSVPPRGTLDLVATGGTAPLSFAVTTNSSGGSVNPMTGVYVAGSTGSVKDTVTVTDANNRSASVTINVGPPLTVTASSTQAKSGTPVTLTAMGGSGTGLVWSLATISSAKTATGTDGTLAPSGATAVYTPGTKAGTATISVVDSLGNQGMLQLDVVSTSNVSSLSLGGGGCAMGGGAGDHLAFDLTALGLALVILGRRARSRRRRDNDTTGSRA